MAKSQSINLFKGRGKSFAEKFINWALTAGRVVVILTEGIALSAFLYRFSLDRQLIDLHESIKQKETIVKLLKEDEDIYRNFQERIQTAGQLDEKSQEAEKKFTDILSFIPPDIFIERITLSSKNLRVDASFRNVSTLSQFVEALREYPEISSVSLDKITNKTSAATLLVGISATFREDNK